MDEAAVREQATSHGEAVMARNLRLAAADVAPEAGAKARLVMGQLPDPISAAEVTDVRGERDRYVATIRYAGEDGEAVVESHWAERDGRPMIVDLRTV